MRVIQKGKAYSRVQLTPFEIECLYFAIMTQIACTLTARQRNNSEAADEALGRQLECELALSKELDDLRVSS